jgi:hypothetical protein
MAGLDPATQGRIADARRNDAEFSRIADALIAPRHVALGGRVKPGHDEMIELALILKA